MSNLFLIDDKILLKERKTEREQKDYDSKITLLFHIMCLFVFELNDFVVNKTILKV